MDNYPEHLAPEFDEEGGVKTPFPEWWQRVSSSFPNVPEDVAEQWLHRHWSHSPYCWLRSADFTFRLISWESERLHEISSGANDWEFPNTVERGKYLVERVASLWLVRYMLEHRTVPRPIIVLDNRDNRLAKDADAPFHCKACPAGFLLIEGHTRFELAAYLHSLAMLDPNIGVWLMERRT